MNEQQMQHIVEAVLAQLAPQSGATSLPTAPIPIESSARHVHLTAEAVAHLFGPAAALESKRALSQPGEFLSAQRVKIVTPGGLLDRVAVLGPARGAVQAELSLTDCRALGIEAPLRLSGDLRGAADVILVGPAGIWEAPGSAIVAQAHIHMTPADATRFGVSHGQMVRLLAKTMRPITLEQVVVRVSEKFALAAHIDFDEANACALAAGDMCQIVSTTDAKLVSQSPAVDKLITEERAKILVKQGLVRLRKGTIVTPAAQDIFTHARKPIEYV